MSELNTQTADISPAMRGISWATREREVAASINGAVDDEDVTCVISMRPVLILRLVNS